MRHFRISIDVDVSANDRKQAEERARHLCDNLARQTWVIEVLPDGIEERMPPDR